MIKKIFLLIGILCVLSSCTKTSENSDEQEIIVSTTQRNRQIKKYGEGAFRTVEVGFDGAFENFDELIEFDIIEPNFDKKFIANSDAKFPFDDSYKQKLKEIIYFIDSKQYGQYNFFLAGLALDKVKKITEIVNYDMDTKEMVYRDMSDPRSLVSAGTYVYTSNLYASKNKGIIDGAFYTHTRVLYYPDKYPKAETEWLGITHVYPISFIYDNASRISEITISYGTYKIEYPSENTIKIIWQPNKAKPEEVETWTFDTYNHNYTYKVNSEEMVGTYLSIEANRLIFEEEATPYGQYDYSFSIQEYDNDARLKIYGNGNRDESYKIKAPTKIYNSNHDELYVIEY